MLTQVRGATKNKGKKKGVQPWSHIDLGCNMGAKWQATVGHHGAGEGKERNLEGATKKKGGGPVL